MLNLVILLLLALIVTGKRKWDKIDAEVSSFLPGGHYILLTFNVNFLNDDTMAKLLDLLAERKTRVTFFVPGNKVSTKEGTTVAKRMLKDRHEIGNYGWEPATDSLIDAPSLSDLQAEVAKSAEVINSASGVEPRIYRPNPLAAVYKKIKDYSKDLNDASAVTFPHQVVLWSVDATTGGAGAGAASITATGAGAAGKGDVSKVLNASKKGDVIMCSVDDKTIEALPGFLDAYQKEGFEFLTVSDMLSFPDDKPH